VDVRAGGRLSRHLADKWATVRLSDTWQLVMNTISSVVTFLMVFLIQNTQNRDSAALQVKIDELIRATSSRQDLIGIEERSGPELDSKRREVRMEDERKSNV
jgi:low affinity Fe/Cu permease